MSDPDDILDWWRLDERVTTSGQPNEAQLSEIAALGVARVVNLGLHTHPRALPDEAGTVAALGMAYHHIPVEFDAPTGSDYAAFRHAMALAGEAPVHVHCIVNARVTAFFYRWRREALGVDEATVRRDLERVWKPGGVWAAFIGDAASVDLPHRYAGRDY